MGIRQNSGSHWCFYKINYKYYFSVPERCYYTCRLHEQPFLKPLAQLMARDISGLTRTAVFVFIVSKSRNMPNVHCICLVVPCTRPGSSTALIADICESAGSCLFILWMIQKRVQCIFFDTFFNDPFQSPALAMAIERQKLWLLKYLLVYHLPVCILQLFFCAWTWWQIMCARSAVQMEAPAATGASPFRVKCTHTCWLSHSAPFHLL